MNVGTVIFGFKFHIVGSIFTKLRGIALFFTQSTAPPTAWINGLWKWESVTAVETSFSQVLMNLFDNAIAVKQRAFALLHQNAVSAQSTVAVFVKIYSKQAFGWPYRVGTVYD